LSYQITIVQETATPRQTGEAGAACFQQSHGRTTQQVATSQITKPKKKKD